MYTHRMNVTFLHTYHEQIILFFSFLHQIHLYHIGISISIHGLCMIPHFSGDVGYIYVLGSLQEYIF